MDFCISTMKLMRQKARKIKSEHRNSLGLLSLHELFIILGENNSKKSLNKLLSLVKTRFHCSTRLKRKMCKILYPYFHSIALTNKLRYYSKLCLY